MDPAYIETGTIQADVQITVGDPDGKRVVIDGSPAIEAYDATGTQTVNIDGEDNFITGTLATAADGQRIEIGQGVASDQPTNEVRLYSGDADETAPGKFQGLVIGDQGVTQILAQEWTGSSGPTSFMQLFTKSSSGTESSAELVGDVIRLTAGDRIDTEGTLNADLGDGSLGSGTISDEVNARIAAAGGGSPTASSVTNTPAGNISATNVQVALNELDTEKAPLASPTFTGTPAAPTAAASTNTTQLATTAFVQSAVSSLIASAPGALDTLDELAAAMGDDANFATTVTNALALKAPLASPALTGNPTAPTQTAGNNSTRVATTAYVDTAVSSQDPVITDYTTAQTNTVYTIPTGAKYLDIEVVGAGGGGGSARRGPSGAVRSGAGGGAGGGKSTRRISVADVAVSSLYVTVGTGGPGGAAVTTNATSGIGGTDGGLSAVRTSVSNTAATSVASAAGGAGGNGGTITNAAGGTAGTASEFVGGNGGGQVSSTGGAGATAVVANGAPSGGGGGGGITSSNVAQNGGNGGVTGGGWNGTVAGGTSAGTVTGTSASAQAVLAPGNGGGGGASSLASAGGTGGNGIRGGGGGGGGASTDGSNSGAGGNGGDGYVRITAWF
jgi:hypothetical protein